MKTRRDDLIGIDFGERLRKGAAEILAEAMATTEKRERAAAQAQWTSIPELAVLIFEERENWWRMETLQPVYDQGIVKVWDYQPDFLVSEMRVKLINLFLNLGIRQTMAECRAEGCKLNIRVMGTIKLKDAQRFEGERA